jgi:5-methyltetrahydropteroyltriglutamate--homocysteine methyltransferase
MQVKYRADEVGSLLRPADLLAARANGTDACQLRSTEDRYILKFLAKQKESGFQVFSDGELRRRNFMSELTDAIDGFDLEDWIARDWDASRKTESGIGHRNRKQETQADACGELS